MSAKGKLVIEIGDDGSIKTNATQMEGSEDEILEALKALAAETGGELTVEKHLEHHHHHGSHHHGHHHKGRS